MTQSNSNQANPKWLILIPTEFERRLIGNKLRIANSAMEICGFGPIVSAARTVQAIQEHQPDRVLLLGIAGSYDLMLPPGTAFSFTQVACYGVGAGAGDSFQTATEMGWAQWPDEDSDRAIKDVISLAPVQENAAQLLTVCSAAGNETEVLRRLQKFPNAIAEDMEGFAVAAACRLCGVPVSIVRGFSNQAGDRDKTNWKIEEAINAAVELCNLRFVSENSEAAQ